MGFIDRYLQRRGFVKVDAISKSAGFMGLESETYVDGKPTEAIRIGDYGTFINAYKSLPWLYAGVTALAIAATKPALRCYIETKGKSENGESKVDQVEIQGQEINRLLELPNEFLSQRELIQILAINLSLTGNAYINLVGTSKKLPVLISKQNPPVEMWWIKPEQVTPKVDELGNVIGYTFANAMGKERVLSPSEIIHFRSANPSSYHVGLGMMEPLTNTATLEFNAQTFQRKFLENDGTPPFIFEHPGEPTEDQRKRFWSAWDERHKGAKNAGRAAMVWGGMKLNKIGESMKDAQYVELKKMNREEMLAGIGVPPSVVGLLEYANYSNMEVQQKKFWEDSVQPMLGLIADMLTLRLAKFFDERMWFEFDYSNIEVLQESIKEKFTYLTSCDWLTVNEKRIATGYKGVGKDGDVVLVSFSKIPITDLSRTVYLNPVDPDESATDESKSCIHAVKRSYWADTERAKMLWGAHEKRVASKERAMIPHVERYLQQQALHIKKRLAKFGNISEVRAADLFDADTEAKLYAEKFMAHYHNALEDSGEAGFQATKGLVWLPEEKAAKEFKVTPEMIENLKQQINKAARFFNDTTWNWIKSDIETAKLEGSTIEDLTQELWKHLDELSISRARLISRTEMARVENWGGIEGYKQNEYVTSKGWLCSMVADSREDHIKANGQEVNLNDAFIVGGDTMEFPGDESHGAPAGQVCNCLCTTFPIVEL